MTPLISSMPVPSTLVPSTTPDSSPPALLDVLSALPGALTWERTTDWLLGSGLQILGVIVGGLVLRWLIHRAIGRVVARTTQKAGRKDSALPGRAGRVLAQATGLGHERQTQRAATMGGLLRSIVSVVVAGVTLLTVMGIVGIPLAPLLASAGVGGVALGFGAQSLVKDFLSGIFMIFEDQYGVGDVIDTGEAIGTVEDVSLRVTRLRDINGVTWYIRNGEIIRIGNRSQGFSTATVDIPVSYSENLEKVIPVIRAVVHAMDEDEDWNDRLLEEPEVLGVESVSGGTVTIRVLATCTTGGNFAVQREIRERVKAAFDAEGIKGPPMMGPFGAGGAGTGAPK